MSIPVILHGQKPPVPTAKEVGAVDNDLGINPITSTADDTVANWLKLGAGIAFYSGAGQLNDQPSASGILTNICRGDTASYIFQIWSVQGGAVYVRSGENTQGWTNSWRKVYDSVNKPTLLDVGGTHENLFINWYFLNPINSKGQTEYTAGETIDNWTFATSDSTAKLKIDSTGVSISGSSSSDNSYYNFQQNIKPKQLKVGQTYTVSFLLAHGEDVSIKLNQIFGQNGNGGWLSFTRAVKNKNLFSVYFTLTETPTNNIVLGIQKKVSETSVTCQAAKLEVGTQQTLARQGTDGWWVLNDVPPNNNIELFKYRKPFINYPWASGTDFNTLITDGVYECQGVNSNTPYGSDGDTHFQIIVLAHNVNWVHQIALDVRDYRIFHRFRINGTWSAWNIMLQQGIPFKTDTDFNTAYSHIDAGFYRMGGGPVTPENNHAPITSYAGGMIIIPTGAWGSGIAQIYIDYQLSRLYIRSNYYDDANKVWKWYDWARIYTANNKPTPAEIGALSLTGNATMTSNEIKIGSGKGALWAGAEASSIYSCDAENDNNNRRILFIKNHQNSLSEAVTLSDVSNGVWAGYKIYGTHNITIGTNAMTAGSSALISSNIYLQYE